jgi:hypothetical protein
MAREQRRQPTARRPQKRRGCFGALLNILSAMLFIVALVAALLIGLLFVAPGVLSGTPLAALLPAATAEILPSPTRAAVAALPTDTATATPGALLLPTWTPVAIGALPTAALLNTPGPTLTPSLTPILPSRTATPTDTPTPTNTPTETPIGPSPTASATRAAFPFTKSDVSPFYLQNFADCNALKIGGEVLDLNRFPVAARAYRVHVWGTGVNNTVDVGTALSHGPSGWEVELFNVPVVRDYNVQLETPNGTAVSQVYNVTTRASCNENLVRFDFVQNH